MIILLRFPYSPREFIHLWILSFSLISCHLQTRPFARMTSTSLANGSISAADSPKAQISAIVEDDDTELTKQYRTPSPEPVTSFTALKERIRHHYELASDYYYSLWYGICISFPSSLHLSRTILYSSHLQPFPNYYNQAPLIASRHSSPVASPTAKTIFPPPLASCPLHF